MTEPEEEDFAAMFEASLKARRFERGQTIEGIVVSIGPEVVFVDVGGKGEASIDIDEMKDSDGNLEVAVGDRIQAVVVSTSGGLTLSRKLARGAATLRQLEDAFESGLPVEGRVERAVKGGFEVTIARQRAFCPFSQIDTLRTEPAVHEGQVYEFRIVEFKNGGRDLVVSRRVLLEVQQRAVADAVRKSVVAGAVMTGRVASVRDFGAFIDLGGGVQGLLHVSEMGWSRVEDMSQVLKAGDEITVKVLRVDDDKQRISLGVKQLSEDPMVARGRNLRGRPGTFRARHTPHRVRCVRRARAWYRSAGAFVDVCANRAIGRLVQAGRGRHDRFVRDPDHRRRQEAHRRGAASGRLSARLRHAAVGFRDRAWRAAHRRRGAPRKVRGVRVPGTRAHRFDSARAKPASRKRRTSPRRFPSAARSRSSFSKSSLTAAASV